MSTEAVVPELRIGIRYEMPSDPTARDVTVRDAVLRRLGSVGVVVQDEEPPRVGERLTFLVDTSEGPLRFGAQVIVRLRGPGGAPWGFGAQIASVDGDTASRLLALRLAATDQSTDQLQ